MQKQKWWWFSYQFGTGDISENGRWCWSFFSNANFSFDLTHGEWALLSWMITEFWEISELRGWNSKNLDNLKLNNEKKKKRLVDYHISCISCIFTKQYFSTLKVKYLGPNIKAQHVRFLNCQCCTLTNITIFIYCSTPSVAWQKTHHQCWAPRKRRGKCMPEWTFENLSFEREFQVIIHLVLNVVKGVPVHTKEQQFVVFTFCFASKNKPVTLKGN